MIFDSNLFVELGCWITFGQQENNGMGAWVIIHEILPDDMPEPSAKAVVTTTTMDANLNHCLATGKSLTGCLHFVDKTATYGS